MMLTSRFIFWRSFYYHSNQGCLLQFLLFMWEDKKKYKFIHELTEKQTKELTKLLSQSEDLRTEHMQVGKSPRVCFAISSQCVCALQLTPQVMAHTGSAHQTLRVWPIFHPFDFVESFVRCHHGDLNGLCQALYWQHHFSRSCLYFPTITSLSVYSLFFALICANLPFCHPHRQCSINLYSGIYFLHICAILYLGFPPACVCKYLLHVYSMYRMMHITGVNNCKMGNCTIWGWGTQHGGKIFGHLLLLLHQTHEDLVMFVKM